MSREKRLTLLAFSRLMINDATSNILSVRWPKDLRIVSIVPCIDQLVPSHALPSCKGHPPKVSTISLSAFTSFSSEFPLEKYFNILWDFVRQISLPAKHCPTGLKYIAKSWNFIILTVSGQTSFIQFLRQFKWLGCVRFVFRICQKHRNLRVNCIFQLSEGINTDALVWRVVFFEEGSTCKIIKVITGIHFCVNPEERKYIRLYLYVYRTLFTFAELLLLHEHSRQWCKHRLGLR